MRRTCVFLAVFVLLISARFASGQGSSVQPQITQQVNEQILTPLSGNTHPMARAQFDQGPAPAGLPMERMLLVLKRSPAQETALRTLVDNQQDKSSPSYHKWLTPDEFGLQFGPADADVQTVTTWLQLHGFQVARVSHSKGVIEFSGTAGQVQQTFHTSIHKYTVNGEDHWANVSDPQIPSALAPAVAGALSLHNFQKKSSGQFAGTFTRDRTTGQIKPVNPTFTFPGGCDQDNNCYAVGPYDFATIYNVLPLWNAGTDGTGQTIAIVGRTNINIQDVRDFRTLFGLPAKDPNIILNGPDPGINSDESEADIDVQWSGAVAKGATIDFVTSQSTETTDGVDLSAEYIVDNNLAPVMSESYGQCELGLGTAGNSFFNSLWEQAAAQGITVMVSTGDNGSAGCDFGAQAQYGVQVSGIASTPFNVAVGGTDFDDFTNPQTYWNVVNDPTTQVSAKGYIPETTWNDSCTNGILATVGFSSNPETNCNDTRLSGLWDTVGGSGGYSRCTVNSQVIGSCSGGYSKPSWQTGAGIPADGKRDLPDVSLFASNGFVGNFYVVCQQDLTFSSCSTFSFGGFGGTSVASPAFAGIMALVNQKTGARQGVANYVLYKLAAQQSASTCNSSNGSNSSCNFNDVTKGTISVPCLTGSPYCQTNVPGHLYGVLTGYSTTTAYDLGTGLGSVNAANVVNNWHTVTFKPSTTTLSITPSSGITHGQSVNVGIGVTGTVGTPTGNVSLLTSTGQSVPGFTLANGNVNGTTALLPGGSYTVTAHYGGDITYGGSDSNAVSVNVAKENSKTTLNLVTFDSNGNIINPNATTAPYGSPYLLRMNVTNSAGTQCGPLGGCATGTLSVTNNTFPLDSGSFTLNSLGYTEDQAIQLPGGTNALQAVYAGDNSFNGSTGNSTVTITPASTSLTGFYAGGNTSTVGTPFYVTASVATTSNGVMPGGSVTFLSNGTPLPGTVTYSGNPGSQLGTALLEATLNVMLSASGSYTFTAVYSGDGNYAPATASPMIINQKYAASFPIQASANSLPAGSTLTLTATIGSTISGAPAPTGSVAFMSTTAASLGTPTYTIVTDPVTGNPDLQASVTLIANVSDSYTASYLGDSNFQPGSASTSVTAMGSDFTLAVEHNSVTVSPGGTTAVQLDVGVQSSPVMFSPSSCSGLPAEASCSFVQPTMAVTGVEGVSIFTTAPRLRQLHKFIAHRSQWPWLPLSATLTAMGLCLMGGRTTKRRTPALRAITFGLLVLLLGCGGGGTTSSGGGGIPSDPGTPLGTYNVTITGTTGSTSHSVNFTLIVQ